jgi:hypothetical protein
MQGDRIHVRNIKGRYPHRPRRLDPANIEARVIEEAHVVRIRIEDSTPGHESAWLEITLEVHE